MYKVLIIDDEKPVREAIKILGEWEKLQVKEIIEAFNGLEGLKLVREKKPDIILLDMKMPEMNGTEFLKLLEAEYPNIKTIIVSGYDSYEFTRQAIQSNVTDYLIKPVNKQELNKAMSKCINIISKKRQEDNNIISSNIMLNVSMPVLKEKICTSIIESNIDKYYKNLYLDMFDSSAKDKYYGVAVFKIMNMEEMINKKFENDVNIMQIAIISVINEIGNENIGCYSFANHASNSELIVIISSNSVFTNDNNSIYYNIIKKVLWKIKELFKVKVIACIGKSYIGIDSISESYKLAKAILYSLNTIYITEGIYTEIMKKIKPFELSILNDITLIKNGFEKGNLLYLRSIISEYLIRVKLEGYFSFKDAQNTIREFVNLVDNILTSLGFTDNIMSESDRKKARVVSYDFITFKEFENILYNIIDVYYKEVRNCINMNETFNVREIKNYIDKNYPQVIKISFFEERYYLSREYIMKLFKDEFGYGIHEYVVHVRMKKAKELLNDGQIKIQTISQILGYSDTNYFSKAFKNYYGISPTSFRSITSTSQDKNACKVL